LAWGCPLCGTPAVLQPRDLSGCAEPVGSGERQSIYSMYISAWRREGSGVTLEQLPVPGGATGRMERGFSQGCGVIGQGGMALN